MEPFLKHFNGFVVTILFLVLPAILPAQDTQFLKGMPTPEQVIEKVKGKDPADTYAKQAGTFMQLRDMISMMIEDKREKFPEASQLIVLYIQQLGPLKEKFEAIKGKKNFDWNRASDKYFQSGQVESEILNNLLTPDTRDMIRSKSAHFDKVEEQKKFAGKATNKIFGLLLIVLSIALFIWATRLADSIAKAEFERTNPHGTQEFPDYRAYKKIHRAEAWKAEKAKWLVLASMICLVIGLAWLVIM